MKTISRWDPEYLDAWPSPGYLERERAALEALIQQHAELVAQWSRVTDEAARQEIGLKVSELEREIQAREHLRTL